MNPSPRGNSSTRATTARVPGFALVVTLSLMILLTVVAVGLLTLSTISLRSSAQSSDMATARSNARMAMMLAIGELQKHAGPDTRITAKADMIDENNPPVLGVWESWKGDDHESSGRPSAPNYSNHKEARFRAWLTSASQNAKMAGLPDTAKGNNKAILLGDKSVGSGSNREELQVHLTPTRVGSGSLPGAFAWWVSGENQKARLPRPYEPTQSNAGHWAVNAKSHAVADPKTFNMDSLLTDSTPALKGISLKQTDLFSKSSKRPTSQEFFHDLSTTSVGLLTNVATGGWKKDLSLFTENSTSTSAKPGTSNLPLFRVKTDKDILCNLPTSDPFASKSMLYPWAAYRGSASDPPIYRHGAVTSWENLRDYVLAYRTKNISFATTGRATVTPVSTAIDGAAFDFLHKVRVLPVIARIQWVFSHTAGSATGTPAPPANMLEPRLLLTPVVTMWNPYNIEMTFSTTPLVFKIYAPLPAALKYMIGGIQNTKYNSLTAGGITNLPALSAAATMTYQISSAFTLKPGETRVFSPVATPVSAGTLLELQPGYRSRGGHYFALKNDAGTSVVSADSATLRAEAKFDTVYNDRGPGVGIYLDMFIGGARHLAYRMIYTPEVANQIYKPLTGLATSDSLKKIQSSPTPFMITVFGSRMASKTHLAAKGFVQSSPLVNYTAMGGKDVVETTIARHYGGTGHPVNSPFDYSFEAVSANDSDLPNESDTTGRGYIVTGFTKADGLSRCVISELPTRPLQSLAELQNWDLRYENPVPPFAFNLIGNSDATPLLPANAVVNSADSGLAVNLQHDDSYCANHLLFDDWFFSSIAPDPTNFGSSGRSIQKVFTDLVTNSETSPLGNRANKPLTQDSAFAAVSTSNANSLYSTYAFKPDSWKTIASRLEVEGMFNVNSTSVTAWRALLGHARDQKVPYIKESGSSWNVDLSSDTDYAFSRFSVAGDVEAKSQGSSGAFAGAAEFAGYRKLDEKTLDAFAEEIVKQIRLRGPFLSLSEFVNRQLSSGNPALAGTIQAALNELAKNNSTNPFSGITAVINRSSLAVPASASSAEYKFPAAAVGQATYGLPGWTRQADVLRALAPILSPRDDTFTIRSYGDARNSNGQITATAVCETVVRRTRDYVDTGDAAEITTLPKKAVNTTFGRRFEVVSFRWLASAEL